MKYKIKHFKEDDVSLNNSFWKWFGNSKVCHGLWDEKFTDDLYDTSKKLTKSYMILDSPPTIDNSKPLSVYHGSDFTFTEFDMEKMKSEKVFMFTGDEKSAKAYGKNIYEVYLKIENPLIVSFKNFDKPHELEFDRIIDFAKKNHDGIITFLNDHAYGVGASFLDLYIVFNANQIKSVNNKGLWSINSNNLYENN